MVSYSFEMMQDLSRREIQAIAKTLGIKANASTSDLIEKIISNSNTECLHEPFQESQPFAASISTCPQEVSSSTVDSKVKVGQQVKFEINERSYEGLIIRINKKTYRIKLNESREEMTVDQSIVKLSTRSESSLRLPITINDASVATSKPGSPDANDVGYASIVEDVKKDINFRLSINSGGVKLRKSILTCHKKSSYGRRDNNDFLQTINVNDSINTIAQIQDHSDTQLGCQQVHANNPIVILSTLSSLKSTSATTVPANENALITAKTEVLRLQPQSSTSALKNAVNQDVSNLGVKRKDVADKSRSSSVLKRPCIKTVNDQHAASSVTGEELLKLQAGHRSSYAVANHSANSSNVAPSKSPFKPPPDFAKMHNRQFGASKSITDIVTRKPAIAINMTAAFEEAKKLGFTAKLSSTSSSTAPTVTTTNLHPTSNLDALKSFECTSKLIPRESPFRSTSSVNIAARDLANTTEKNSIQTTAALTTVVSVSLRRTGDINQATITNQAKRAGSVLRKVSITPIKASASSTCANISKGSSFVSNLNKTIEKTSSTTNVNGSNSFLDHSSTTNSQPLFKARAMPNFKALHGKLQAVGVTRSSTSASLFRGVNTPLNLSNKTSFAHTNKENSMNRTSPVSNKKAGVFNMKEVQRDVRLRGYASHLQDKRSVILSAARTDVRDAVSSQSAQKGLEIYGDFTSTKAIENGVRVSHRPFTASASNSEGE